MNNRDKAILQKIVKYCEDIDKLIKRFGDSYEMYNADFAYQYASSMCIIQIGELAGQLSEETKNAKREVPWRIIKDMRNLFAHDYARVDNEIVWDTLKTSIPDLYTKCLRILEEEGQDIQR